MQACRTCLKLIDASQCKYFEIEGEDVQLTASSVRYKILSIVPEMALNIVKPSIICEPCHMTLESLITFKSTCMKTENMIMHYLNTTLHINPAVLNLRSIAVLYKSGYAKDPILQPVIDFEVPVKEELGDDSEVSEDINQDSFVDNENITIVKHEVTNYDSEIVEILPPDNKVLCMTSKEEQLICNEMQIEVTTEENKEVDLKTIHSSHLGPFQLQKEVEEIKTEESKPIKCDITHIPSSIPVPAEAIDKLENLVTSDAQSNKCDSKAGPDIKSDASKNKLATEKKENEFKCEVCLKNFVNRFRLKAHMLCHTDERPYKCTLCPKAFNDGSTLNKHKKIHTGIKEFQCGICQREFYSRGNLNKHALTHSEKLFECQLCGKKFARRDSLTVHLMVHTGERNYVCAYCDKRCIDSSALNKHLRCHTGDKPYECEICKNRFTQKTHLTVHKRQHTGERPYHCDECGKSFLSNNSLKIHIRTHTKEKPYTCEVCLRKFSSLSNFSMHRKIHIGKRDFNCASCTKSFIHKDDLKKHVLVHAQEKPFSCHICKKSFSKKMRAKSHILNQHKHVDINTIVFERYKTTVLGQETDDDKNVSNDSNVEVEILKDEPKILVNGDIKMESLN